MPQNVLEDLMLLWKCSGQCLFTLKEPCGGARASCPDSHLIEAVVVLISVALVLRDGPKR